MINILQVSKIEVKPDVSHSFFSSLTIFKAYPYLKEHHFQ
jgi:hypothetical protein